MYFSVIAPIPHLEEFCNDNFVHLTLAHWAIEHPDTYGAYYRDRGTVGDLVILDNAAYEFGGSVDMDVLCRAIDIIQPEELVLPDTIRDPKKTFEKTMKALEDFDWDRNYPGLRFMVVPQGGTQNEWELCAMLLADNIGDRIYSVGIPRAYADDFGSWIPAVEVINRVFGSTTPIHLLGSPHRLTAAAQVEQRYPGRVRSTDTAKPIHYAIAGQVFVDPLQDHQRNPNSRPKDYITHRLTKEERDHAAWNIRIYRKHIGA